MMKTVSGHFVVTLIGTYQRYNELKRCLDCIQNQVILPGAVLVIDNAASIQIKELVELYGSQFIYLPMDGNKGCGAALKVGEEYAFNRFESQLSHFWILDDDAAPAPDTLEKLLTADAVTNAALIAPVCTCPDGSLFGYPDVIEQPKRRVRKAFKFPKDVQDYYGNQLVPIVWCVGVCYLVKARAIKQSGFHRNDFWMQGDDIEFAMRICKEHGGVLVPWVITPHLYPIIPGQGVKKQMVYTKACSLLQNITYIGLHEIRTRRTIYYIFANIWRYFKGTGCEWNSIKYGIKAIINGAILAQPSGKESGARLRKQIAAEFGDTIK